VAIVKVSYTRSKAKIKASVRYIQHRPGKAGERQERSFFGIDGALTRDDVYKLIDQAAKGTTFFRLILSPDPRGEDSDRDLNLREITEQTLLALAEELGQRIEYAGVIHDDHAPHRHVHVVALILGELTREHFQLLRKTATEAALFQRRERDLARGITERKSPAAALRPPASPGGGGGSPTRKPQTCSICGMQNCLIHENGLELTQ
jgi:hypothetical protein